MAKKGWLSRIALLMILQLAFIAVVGNVIDTVNGIHEVPTNSAEPSTSHHHHLTVIHFDHELSEFSHQHSSDNLQPIGLALTHSDINLPNNKSSFLAVDATDVHDIYLEGLLRPPRLLL